MMNIAATQFSLQTKSFEIYLSGCNRHCLNCHNPELQNFDIGENYYSKLDDILGKIHEFSCIIENIWILGGEPLDQDIEELNNLLIILRRTNKKIWLFTGYEFLDVSTLTIKLIDFLKTGEYDEIKLVDDNIQYKIKLPSSNQKIWVKGKDYPN